MPTPVLVLGTNLTLPRPALSMWPGRYLRMSDSTLSRSLVSVSNGLQLRALHNSVGALHQERKRSTQSRLPTACPELLPGVLLLVQHRASSFRSRTADPRGGSQPPGRTGPRPPSAHARHRYAAHPERFVRKPPQPPALPTAVWINPPPKPESGPPDSEETVQSNMPAGASKFLTNSAPRSNSK